MKKTKATKRRTGKGQANYVIVGKRGQIHVVSGSTGKITTLDKARADRVLALVRARQQIGRELASLLNRQGFVVADQVVIDIEL
jgi:hypothetical protein